MNDINQSQAKQREICWILGLVWLFFYSSRVSDLSSGCRSGKCSQAVQAIHELMHWLIPQLDKLPRQRRYSLGVRIETCTMDVLEVLNAYR